MTSRFVYRTAIAIILAAGFAFVAGRWTAPKPPAPVAVCPHVPSCAFCQGWDAFHAGRAITDNPHPQPPEAANDRSQPRHQWATGWAAAQREAGE
jgi:hypothetical protein